MINRNRIEMSAIPIATLGAIPNNPNLPVLRYRGAFDPAASDLAETFESIFGRNHWANGWRNGVYPYTHWHCTAHEVLGVFAGSADVQLGGESGVTVSITAGDVVLVPAGVAHKRLDDRPGLGIVGAYPDGQSPDLCRGDEAVDEAVRRVLAVPRPSLDPVFADDGPMQEQWSRP